MKFKIRPEHIHPDSTGLTFEVGDIVIPKSEWLDSGEIAQPAVVLDIWHDKDLNKDKIAVINLEEAEQIASGTLVGFPHSRLDTFADYYNLYNKEI